MIENEDEKRTPVRSYTKAELAMMYNPEQCITLAIYTLARWVRYNAQLKAELEAVGYNKYRRCFTPLEVRILFKYLGEP